MLQIRYLKKVLYCFHMLESDTTEGKMAEALEKDSNLIVPEDIDVDAKDIDVKL